MLFFGFIFGCIFGGIWLYFWCYFGRCWEVFFGTFSNFVKNGAPHENAVNSSKNEGPAPRKSRKKRPETEGKTVGKRRRKNNGSCVDFGCILGGFGEPFRVSKCVKKQGEILGSLSEGKKVKKGRQKA